MKIIFATDSETVSGIIRIATNCQWSHVGSVFGDFVIEARFKGVVKTPLDEFKARGKHEIIDYPLKDEGAGLGFALDQVGKDYDFAGLISFPLRANWENPRKWNCSESFAAITKAGGSPIVHDDLNGVSPRDLYVILKYITIQKDLKNYKVSG